MFRLCRSGGIVLENGEIDSTMRDGSIQVAMRAGTKFIRTNGMILRGNHVHDNFGGVPPEAGVGAVAFDGLVSLSRVDLTSSRIFSSTIGSGRTKITSTSASVPESRSL
jgi:hypothetical protein